MLIGVATRTNGVLRLLKALRHEAPNVAMTQSASVLREATPPPMW